MRIFPQAMKPCPPELEEFSHSKFATLTENLYIEHTAKEWKVFTHLADAFCCFVG